MIKYFKPIFFASKKLMLISLATALAIGAAIHFIANNHPPIYIPMLIALLAWVIIWILLFVLVASTMKKEQPLEDIMIEKGYCDEWLQKHSEIYPTPDRQQKLRRVDVLSYLDRYQEARALLESIPTAGMSDDRTYEYNNAWLDMLLTTGHYDEAVAKLESCRKFMDIYANANPLRGAAYGLNAAVIRAIAGDYQDSEHFLNAAEHAVTSAKSMSPALVNIAKTMQLYALGFTDRAEAQEEQTYQAIQNDEKLTKQWQKDHFLAMLGKAQNLIPEKRAEGKA